MRLFVYVFASSVYRFLIQGQAKINNRPTCEKSIFLSGLFNFIQTSWFNKQKKKINHIPLYFVKVNALYSTLRNVNAVTKEHSSEYRNLLHYSPCVTWLTIFTRQILALCLAWLIRLSGKTKHRTGQAHWNFHLPIGLTKESIICPPPSFAEGILKLCHASTSVV